MQNILSCNSRNVHNSVIAILKSTIIKFHIYVRYIGNSSIFTIGFLTILVDYKVSTSFPQTV